MSDETKSNEPLKLTEEEWRAKRQRELGERAQNELVTKVIELEMDNRTLRAQIPKDAALILTKADAERWKAYSELGKPEDLKTQLDALSKEAEQGRNLKRSQLYRDVADAYGYKHSVLSKLLSTDGLEVVFNPEAPRKLLKDGKEVEAKGTATVKDSGGKELALEAYAAERWVDFLPSLTVEPVEQKRGPVKPLDGLGDKPRLKTEDEIKAELRPKVAGSF